MLRMGKSKKREQPRQRQNPTTGRPPKPPLDADTAALRDQKILPVIAALAGPEPKKRSEAAIAIANLIEDQRCRKLLLKEHIVRVIMEQTITDSNLEVVSAGWGVLRNLALEESKDFVLHLFRQDILTPVEAAIRNLVKMTESTQPSLSKLPMSHQRVVWSLTESIISILSSLASVNTDVTEAMSKVSVIPGFLFGLLELPTAPDHVKEAALLCLHTLIGEADSVVKTVADHPRWLQVLTSHINKPDSIGSTACGVMYMMTVRLPEVGVAVPDGCPSGLFILKLLDAQLDRYFSGAASNAEKLSSEAVDENERTLGLVLEFIGSIATRTYLQAEDGPIPEEDELEVFGEDDDMEDYVPEGSDEIKGNNGQDEDAQSSASSVAMGEVVDDNPMTNETHLHDDKKYGQTSTSLQSDESIAGFLINGTTPKLLSLFKKFRNSQPDPGASRRSKTAISHRLPLSIDNLILLILDDLAWTIAETPMVTKSRQEWPIHAQNIWTEIIHPVLNSNTADVNRASTIASLAWAIARTINGHVNLSGDEHKTFMALYQASTTLQPESREVSKFVHSYLKESGRELGSKCIAVLGCLARCPNQISRNRDIGAFLLMVLNNLPQTPPEDAIETSNQIFEIYADKEFDYDEPVFVQGGFLAHLQALQPKVQKLAKSIDKRKEPELRGLADEAVVNLKRFIKYKMEERQA